MQINRQHRSAVRHVQKTPDTFIGTFKVDEYKLDLSRIMWEWSFKGAEGVRVGSDKRRLLFNQFQKGRLSIRH